MQKGFVLKQKLKQALVIIIKHFKWILRFSPDTNDSQFPIHNFNTHS
jgi:hypothetical protein